MNSNKLLLFLIITLSVIAGCKNPSGNDLEETEKPDTEKPSFTLSYNANGADSGSVPGSIPFAEGESVTIAGNEGTLVKSGYPFFVGWNTAADGSGDFLRPGDTMKMPGSDQTLYAYWVGVDELAASGGKGTDKFGFSVDIDGDYAVVGAPRYQYSGAVYVFHRTGANSWDGGTRLDLDSSGTNVGFGESVSISGDYLLVGASWVDPNGIVYVYERTGTNSWGNRQELKASDPEKADYFGSKVSLDGDYAAIGTSSADAVYVYKKGSDGWNNTNETIIPSPGGTMKSFGLAVSLDGETLAIGSSSSNDSFNNGSVYVYNRTGENTWGTPAVISTPEPSFNENFAYSVALDGDFLVVGDARYDNGSNTDQGAAFVYKRSGENSWGSPAKLLASDGKAKEEFGTVAIRGNTILVGAHFAAVGGHDSQGAVYMFARSGTKNWNEVKKLTDSKVHDSDHFSIPALDGTSIIIGADHLGKSEGTAPIYLYQ